jgi:hypothetical protein
MLGIRSADIQTYSSLDALPDDVSTLLDAADSLFAARGWWQTVVTHAMPDGVEPCFVVCRNDGAVAALFPMLRLATGAFGSLTTPYSCLYTPLIAPGADAPAAFEAFGRFCWRQAVVRLDALPVDWPYWGALAVGLRAAGLVHRRFDHFGNWHEYVTGLDWTAYLASRPGALRETIRRRLRRAERLPDAQFSVVGGAEGLDVCIAAFEDVYARSWKEPEPFPTFNAALMRTAAALGILRLGLWSIGRHPVAAQFWIVEHGRATVLKLAHDEAFTVHSPGTILTALMLRHLLDDEKVDELDFGRGDDPYKRDWVGQRRQRVGLIVLAPWRCRGLLALARHDAGQLYRRWRSNHMT